MDPTDSQVKVREKAPRERDRPIRLGGLVLSTPRHICAFFKNPDDEYRILLPFIKDGFECGEKAVHVVDPKRRDNTSNGWRRQVRCGARATQGIRPAVRPLRVWQVRLVQAQHPIHYPGPGIPEPSPPNPEPARSRLVTELLGLVWTANLTLDSM